MNAVERRNRFKSNMLRLMEDQGLSARQLALECDIPLKWVSRACEGGLDRLYVRNEEQLTKLAAFLGLSHPKEFWRETPLTDLPTAIRDEWKDLAGSPFERLADKELKACRDACCALVKCRKVYDLIRQMPDGHELAEMYLVGLASKEERSFWKSIEDEAESQHARLIKQREQNNLTALLKRVRQMESGESVVEEIEKELDQDKDRWLIPYSQGTTTMREYWVKAIDVLGEEEAADRLYWKYARGVHEPMLRDFFKALEAIGEGFADKFQREAEKPESRKAIIDEIEKLGLEEAALRLYRLNAGNDLSTSTDAPETQPVSPEPEEEVIESLQQDFPDQWSTFVEKVHENDPDAASEYVRKKWQEALDKTGGTVTAKDFAIVFYKAHLK
ncbi:MAG: hypothetical protein H6824_10410 [Planctomycetaceae bacterium]|nr:hypothetical protein [Planctomycetaceae bacterium]